MPARLTQRGGVRFAGIWKFVGLVRASVSRSVRLDLGAAELRLQIPGKGQHVAPQAVGEKQVRRGLRVLRLQGRAETRQPVLRLGRRRRVFAFGDISSHTQSFGAYFLAVWSSLAFSI